MALFKRSDLQGVQIKYFQKSASSVLLEKAQEFSEEKTYDIFVSHSYTNANEILNLSTEINRMGFSTYIDWREDPQLNRSQVTRANAELLRKRMRSCKSFLFFTSETSPKSIWMPWELGYFDGVKKNIVAILPLSENSYDTNSYIGQEYLGLYPYVTKDPIKNKDTMTLWVHDNERKYVCFSEWLNGKKPYVRE